MSRFFCYRWLPRTIIPNIRWMFLTIYYGVKNIIIWTPVIFFDDWIDWSYLTRIMEFKLRIMAGKYEKYGCHVGAKRNARQMLICSLLLKRINNDNYFITHNHLSVKVQDRVADYDMELLFKLLNKYLKTWWD